MIVLSLSSTVAHDIVDILLDKWVLAKITTVCTCVCVCVHICTSLCVCLHLYCRPLHKHLSSVSEENL